MNSVGTYILRLIAAAVICGLISSVVGTKGALASVVKLMSGLFLCFCVISPFLEVNIANFMGYLDDLQVSSDGIVAEGETAAKKELETIIKSKTEAYILDKAASYGAELAVEVTVDTSSVPVPNRIRVSGAISPYGKKQLQQIIANELGIALEAQIWTE